MSTRWRTPVKKECNHCHEDYIIYSGRKTKKFCSLQCQVEAHRRFREVMNIIPRDEERRMWRDYWKYYFKGVRNPEDIQDPVKALNFKNCKKELKEKQYSIKSW